MTPTSIQLPSPAKLNLFLHIIGRRDDGYHQLQTLFQFIDLCDLLTFRLTKEDRIDLTTPVTGVANDDNLIVQAAKKLLPYRAKQATQGVKISIQKQLPMGGGIGGGSSNAATTLLALNQLWQCHLTLEQLADIGVSLGADVPIFIFGKSAFAEGVGEQLTEIHPPESYYLLLKPNCEVKTEQIFMDKGLTRDTPAIKISHVLKLDGHNDCLDVVRRHSPEVNDAYIWLKNQADAKLTGTGSCLFAEFSSRDKAASIRENVPKPWLAWVCQGHNVSPTHKVLDQWMKDFWGIAKR
ncbi:4-(cytidine 5'-diphospho)-2-C-methyl-D-erythritol kinase [Marinomonas agarivorans]|nr:4-(cytidine 5'-diphospho)-2-C-methyl-D-erythritol kinase [Marinomonas agarivorans]